MASCPKCSYSLVLLEHRSKYKCALCSRLYSQKEIDDKEFREKNKRQRTLDVEDYERELKKERTQLRTMKKYMKYLFNGIPKYLETYKKKGKLARKPYDNLPKLSKEHNEEWKLKNREKDLRRKQGYYQKNKQGISFKEKIRRRDNLELHNQRKKAWRAKNLETMRTYGLIQHYRRRQKAIALQYLKNSEYKPSSAEIFHSVPTYSLSYLLF